ATSASPFRGRTAWARNVAAPLRDFLNTETGGAVALLAATVAALVWANSPWSHSYDSVWGTELSIRLGDASIAMDLRHWVNEGLMTFFFLVVGLEAKRELELGQLRERRRLAALSVMSVAAMASAVGATSRSTRAAAERTGGAPPCRPTPRSRSACSHSSRRPARASASRSAPWPAPRS